MLFGWRWCRDIHVNFLRATSAEQAPSKNKGRSQKQNHKDYQHCDNTRAAAATAISIVSHKRLLPFVGGLDETN
jgi:hypothetical protein